MSDDAILVAFCEPPVPRGWALRRDRSGNVWWTCLHDSGLTLEVYPPATPRADNLVHWCVKNPRGERLVWGVCETRDQAFVASVPKPIAVKDGARG